MNDRTPVVKAQSVGRTFGTGPSSVVALQNCTCEMNSGDRIVLTGRSGSGKTTLLHLLAGLDTPTTGIITWPAIGEKTKLRPGPIAVVFQAPSLLPALDVLENAALPLLLGGADRQTARSRALDALDALGLAGLRSKLPEELSGGQAQRVAVARVLASDPRLVLADEPTGQLDRATGSAVVDALIAAAVMSGAALLVNSHDPAVVERFDDRWSMDDGHLTTSDERVVAS